MIKATNIKRNMLGILAIFTAMFGALIAYLLYSDITYGAKWFATPYNPRIAAANNIADAGTIYDRNGVVLARSSGDERVYAESENMRRSVSHVVGDVTGKTLGAEMYFAKYLYGYDPGLLNLAASAASGKKGADVYLTIDAKLSKYIYEQMDFYGAVVMMNYKTGEILAMVSKPTFDPEAIAEAEEDEETGSYYLNRATQGRYPPGSTIKIITASAAIDSGVTDLVIDCDGEEIIAGQRVTCPKKGGHGTVDLNTAFEKSCNIYFGILADEIGAPALKASAEQYLFNYEFNVPDFLFLKSTFPETDNEGDLAWAGIGQYKDLVTPLHNALIASAIANGGRVMRPNTLLDVKYGQRSAFNYTPVPLKTTASASTAARLSEMMRNTVKEGTATSADIGGATINGKTGTAEFVEDGEVKNHSWFVGFSEDEDFPYAVSVILEGAGFGSAQATPLAAKVFKKALELGY